MSCQSGLYDGPLSPDESLATFTYPEDLEVTIYATEPFVLDPVDISFNEKGEVFVVEMPDYPFKPEPGEGKGRIKMLHDRNGDGRIDDATIFAEGISEATSVLPWKGGLLIAAAPTISFWKDTDGDGRSDSTEIIFEGFFENNSEAQITNLKFGIDNWIYASNHGQNGEIKYLRDPTIPTLQIQGGDFRFRLDRDQFEMEAGPAQFGQAFNNRGHRFVTQNSLHIRHVVIPWRYTHRHPYLPSTQVAYNISDHEAEMFQMTPPPYWRAERTRRRQLKYDEQGLGRKEYAEDFFTGCSGGTFYAGHSLPQAYFGNIFTGEVAGNLIHRDLVSPHSSSPTYVATRAPGEYSDEFLSSTDSWFRPAHFGIGPDGFLYVVDYYRQHIETPLSIPADLKEDMDFLRGDDKGRIYRITPKGQSQKVDQTVSELFAGDLIDLLRHQNRWHRLTAQRLILERQEKSLIPRLRQMLIADEFDHARLHALYALEGMGAISDKELEIAVSDSYAGVREHGIILAEHSSNGVDIIRPRLIDPDVRVAFQAILSLGQFDHSEVADILMDQLEIRKSDRWFRMAVLSSKVGGAWSFAKKMLNRKDFWEADNFGRKEILEDICGIVGFRNASNEVSALLEILLQQGSSLGDDLDSILTAMMDGVKKSRRKLQFTSEFKKFLSEAALEDRQIWGKKIIDLEGLNRESM